MPSTKKLFAALRRRGPHRVLRGDLAFAGLPGVVYTPESGFNLPGVAFAHEWVTGAERYLGTLEHLASWGIVAAAPDTEKGIAPSVLNLAFDIGTTLDIIAGVRLGDGKISVHPTKLGIVGHGFGASTAVFAAAGMPAKPKAVVAAFPTITKPRAEAAAASLKVPGLILVDPGDPMSLRSNAVELARAWDSATLRAVPKAEAGGLIEGRRLAKVVGLPGADRSTQKLVRALMTGYLLHMLTGDKTYRDFADPEVALPKATTMDPFADDPVDLENKVVALLKPVESQPTGWVYNLSVTSERSMRTGIFLNYAGGFLEAVDEVVELEKVGVDIALVAEAYSFDAISQLGFLAAKTSRIELGSVVPIYIRTPSLLAMTAAGLDYVSDGRFRLGIGTSGPQVMEGFHGVPFDAPLGRTREVVEICRQVWRRENVQFDGKHYQIPLPADRGTGLGKPLHLINHPVRERIPITIAALGPKNVELTAEIAEGWQPVFFYPEKADEAWGDSLRAGMAKRDPTLGPLDVMVSATLAIGDDVEDRLAWAKPQLALYIGGMGARGKNFYHNLATRYGFGDVANHIQDLYLSGQKTEAIDAVPEELVRHVSLIGPKGFVKERVAAYAEAGVTTLLVHPLTGDRRESVRYVEELQALLP